MKTKLHRQSGLSLMEVFLVIGTVVVLAVVFLPMLANTRGRSCGLGCVNRLKQIGLSYRLWSNDHGDRYPFAVSTNSGGTLEFVSSSQVFRHYQSISNELNTPKVLICPQDPNRKTVRPNNAEMTGFENLSNRNISYFVGLDADETKPERLLSGDRNITGGVLSKGFLRMLNTNSPAGWTALIHSNAGNIVLADGSVQQMTAQTLQRQLQIQSLDIIRLTVP